ncbi:hypothetical protein ESA_00864 [Cronobacter sakazakii ATCC BAA-894]|uniref:Uncharacterized protein n=1 Tax=Cronobacter sakazakii (strain ATCC BAA-894) TaxID=290339 RepID=A7MKU4_CROS8|nr:hypothetical protein ESA_00864 [Cronobacter sakazakii ATCC BAA-894]
MWVLIILRSPLKNDCYGQALQKASYSVLSSNISKSENISQADNS